MIPPICVVCQLSLVAIRAESIEYLKIPRFPLNRIRSKDCFADDRTFLTQQASTALTKRGGQGSPHVPDKLRANVEAVHDVASEGDVARLPRCGKWPAAVDKAFFHLPSLSAGGLARRRLGMVLLSGIPLPTSPGSDPAIRKRRVALQELDSHETGTSHQK